MSWIETTLTRLPHYISENVLFGGHFVAPYLQVAVQHAIGGQHAVSFPLDGFTFNCRSSHKYFFQRENYERELWPVLCRSVGPQDVVYEVGAHYGYWALRLSRRCAHVFAFEPSPENFAQLSHNIDCNAIGNITAISAACAAREGHLAFAEEGSMARVANEGITVPAVTLDGFATDHPMPSLILMDVEGFGGEVLQGASRVLSQGPNIVCEIHSKQEFTQFMSALEPCGYRFEGLEKKDRYPFRLAGSK